MKRPSLSQRDRRAVVWGIIALGPALLYFGAVKPYVERLAATRDRTAIESDALAREQALLALAPHEATIRQSFDSVVSVSQARLFGASDDGIASADLAAYVARIAREHNVWFKSADPRGSKTSPNGVRALVVDIQAESDFEGIRSFLHAMERGTKLLRIDQVNITPGSDSSAARPVLQLRAAITGYALRGVPVPKAGVRKEQP